MLFVLTAGDTVVVRDYDSGETAVVRRQDSLLRLGPWYLGLALCWLLQLAVNCQSVVVAGAAADWYFNRYTLTPRGIAPVQFSFTRSTRQDIVEVPKSTVVLRVRRNVIVSSGVVRGRLAGVTFAMKISAEKLLL